MDPDRHAEIKGIFLEVCDLPEDERTAFLDRSCRQDPDLRAEVDALLAHDNPEDPITARDLLHPNTGSGREDSTALGVLRAGGLRPSWIRRLDWKRLLLFLLLGIVMAGVWWWGRQSVRSHQLKLRGEQLQAILETTGQSLQIWIEDRLEAAAAPARDPVIRQQIEILSGFDPADADDLERLKSSPAHQILRDRLTPIRPAGGYDIQNGYTVFNMEGYILAAEPGMLVGHRIEMGWGEEREWIRRGKQLFVPTIGDLAEVEGLSASPGERIVTIHAPLVAGMDLEFVSDADRFLAILASGSFGDTGETFAFKEEGRLLSEVRPIEELNRLGWLPDTEPGLSNSNLWIRDPGGDVTAGFRPGADPEEWLPTRLIVASVPEDEKGRAPEVRSGLLLDPYRNYLGRPVIGAWMWIPIYGSPFGIATEMEVREALAPVRRFDVAAAGLCSLIFFASILGYFSSRKGLARRLKVSEETGQYTLSRKIGEGGLGEVFLASHAMLKRPTAVKILKPEAATGESIKRFEREVQLASHLAHPNTIQIFDFGRTDEGLFYYAMEFLDGLNLAEVVRLGGGPLGVARTVFILRQVCDSLREAHQQGLIHRDIKPANIMLCRRGGAHDVVKVLDFGLVKQIESDQWTAELTRTNQISGSLNYLAPERIRNPQMVDRRTDLYAVGAVAYFLLTEKNPFSPGTDLDGIHQILTEEPEPLSSAAVAGVPIPPELERLITRCLAKEMDDRPKSSDEMLGVLDAVQEAHPWTEADAKGWWESQKTGESGDFES